ncbi:DUF4115 domain-containing protein [hot springs metagenome]|uniref:DUF4115 domain-containing protein n=1 Tax=hot springs metagenome TaxID=433727 RepID=A0A5J4L7Z0_9ZZZZ
MAKSLKEQRERLGKDIKDIAMITRVKASYLKAIEDEDFSKLPAEVYTRGYINIYAKFLGYPPDAAIAPYDAYLQEVKAAKEKNPVDIQSCEKSPANISNSNNNMLVKDIGKVPISESEPMDYSHVEITDRKKHLDFKKFTKTIVMAGSAIGAALLIYLLIPGGKNTSHVSQKMLPGAQYDIHEASPPSNPPPPTATPNTSTALPDKTIDKDMPVQKKRHNLDITATDKTWIQIVIDGSDKKEMLLNAGEKVNYGADQSINLLIGNAAGVKLKFDGKEFEGLGEKGQVIKLSLPSTIPPSQPSNSSNL